VPRTFTNERHFFLEATMSLKRNLLMLAAYVGALLFISLPFTMIEAKGPPATFVDVAQFTK
jgi:hypothetical protein